MSPIGPPSAVSSARPRVPTASVYKLPLPSSSTSILCSVNVLCYPASASITIAREAAAAATASPVPPLVISTFTPLRANFMYCHSCLVHIHIDTIYISIMHLLPDHMSVFNYSITHRMGGEGVGRASPLYLYSHPQEQSPCVFITDILIF